MKKYLSLVCFWAFAALFCMFSAVSSAAEEDGSPYAFSLSWTRLPASAPGAEGSAADGKNIPGLVLLMKAADTYHSYAHDSPGGVYPLELSLDPPVSGAKILYPQGKETQDIFEPEKTVRILEGQSVVLLLFPQDLPPSGSTLRVNMLACSELRCVPIRSTLSVPGMPAELPLFTDLFPEETELLKREAVPPAGAATRADSGQALSAARTSVFSAYREEETAPESETLRKEETAPASGELPEFSPRAFVTSLEVTSLGKAVAFGMLAGLILNVMPCVLPVIALKINALLQGGNSPEALRRFRRHNFWFAVGILFWFVILALLFAFAGYAWGQLFQNTVFLLVMLGLIFLLALTMFDVFHLPVLDLRGSQSGQEERMPRANAFLTGLLATLLATPCSGPLLGGVLGWSLTQGWVILITVFTATGVGMALPYLAMTIWPGIAAHLPRPGGWMLAVERLLGFFLLGTCLYFLTILPSTMMFPALTLLFTLALSAWIWGTWGELRAKGVRRLLILALCLALPLAAVRLGFFPDREQEIAWKEYSPEFFRAQLGKTPLFVEFTADWCPTCKVLERTTLTPEHLRPLLERNTLTPIRVDLTRDDASGQTLLKALGSASIPMLAIFPAGSEAGSPVILRDIYTVEQMQGAVKQALHNIP